MTGALFRIAISFSVLFLFTLQTGSAEVPFLQHAETRTGSENIDGWVMSEKLDGIRGYWTGSRLLTRKGKTIHAPDWFTEKFPQFPLDGELWRKRDDFSFVQKTVLDKTPSEDWKEITYNIFEVPEMPGDFPARLDAARSWFKTHKAPHVRIIDQIVCSGPDHLDSFLSETESAGGEGVIIKNPALPYHSGRSPDVLKVKTFRDMEGIVIGHNPGKGKFSGMMGSLTLRLENGIEFKLGTGFTISDRETPPPIGSVVTFKYHGLTQNNIPRFASFLHVRRD